MRNLKLQRFFRQPGFTLVEIAIVLLIVSVLLGYTVALFPVQQDLKKSRQADQELDQIIDQLVAFAQVNGRLPCPDTSAGVAPFINGLEDTTATGCEAYFGFLPAKTLAMNGKFNDQGVLMDPWGSGYRYAVSAINIGKDGDLNVDLVSPNGIKFEGIANVIADLAVCEDSAAPLTNDADCLAATGVADADVVTNVAAVVISLGKDINDDVLLANNSAIQIENLDDFHDGTNDKVYVYSTRSDRDNFEFDDSVRWLSTNQLFSKMIEAGQLP